MLAEAKQRFIEKKQLVGRDEETVSPYESLISEFLSGSGKVFADQIEEVDLLRFCDGLRTRGLSERTVMNYYGCHTRQTPARKCRRILLLHAC